MDKYLNSSIKEVIVKFPEIADILNSYNIGCVNCGVGTCLLKDIVSIHNLSSQDEEELMSKIAGVIAPNSKKKPATLKKDAKPKAHVVNGIKYSPPLKKLVDEHVLIKKWLELIPEVIKGINISTNEWEKIIADGVDFMRSYADKFHHAKEEDILFKYFDKNLDVIEVMHRDHETGRSYVRATIDALEKKDKDTIIRNLNAYRDLLTEHIKKEDEILYPWMDRALSTTKIGELAEKFNELETQKGALITKKYQQLIASLLNKFNK